jgi:hypothetical protein
LFQFSWDHSDAQGPADAGQGKEPRCTGQLLDRGFTGLARDDADQEEEHGGREDACLPPAGDAVPSLADRGHAADQDQDDPGVGARLGQQRDAPHARSARRALAAGELPLLLRRLAAALWFMRGMRPSGCA